VVSQVVVPLAEIEKKLSSGALEDSKTIIGLREMLMTPLRAQPALDNRQLYSWYADENHKYNTVIWGFPSVVIALNLAAFQTVTSHWSLFLAMWMINNVLLFVIAKHVYHQRCFTRALERIAEEFRKEPGLHVVHFPKTGWHRLFRYPATWVMVGALLVANQAYAVAVLWRVLAGVIG